MNAVWTAYEQPMSISRGIKIFCVRSTSLMVISAATSYRRRVACCEKVHVSRMQQWAFLAAAVHTVIFRDWRMRAYDWVKWSIFFFLTVRLAYVAECLDSEGNQHANGTEPYIGPDACNTCHCSNGESVCTKMFCTPGHKRWVAMTTVSGGGRNRKSHHSNVRTPNLGKGSCLPCQEIVRLVYRYLQDTWGRQIHTAMSEIGRYRSTSGLCQRTWGRSLPQPCQATRLDKIITTVPGHIRQVVIATMSGHTR